MNSKIVLAMDGVSLSSYTQLASVLGPRVHAIKVHHVHDEVGAGGHLRSYIPPSGKLWIDHKLHDTPDTVALRVVALRRSGADIITVHASGGPVMLKAALDAAGDAEIYAVTVLTSLADEEAAYIYGARSRGHAVLRLASFAVNNGVHGLVCSPNEVAMLRQELGPDVKLVVPGTRSIGKDTHDQKNVRTPADTIAAGASLLVIGRQVTQAKDPLAALAELEQEIAGIS